MKKTSSTFITKIISNKKKDLLKNKDDIKISLFMNLYIFLVCTKKYRYQWTGYGIASNLGCR